MVAEIAEILLSARYHPKAFIWPFLIRSRLNLQQKHVGLTIKWCYLRVHFIAGGLVFDLLFCISDKRIGLNLIFVSILSIFRFLQLCPWHRFQRRRKLCKSGVPSPRTCEASHQSWGGEEEQVFNIVTTIFNNITTTFSSITNIFKNITTILKNITTIFKNITTISTWRTSPPSSRI